MNVHDDYYAVVFHYANMYRKSVLSLV